MHAPASPSITAPSARRPGVRSWAVIVLVAGFIAYANSLTTPFVFDDVPNIAKNESLRNLGSPDVLRPPPAAAGTVGRPLVNLSLALNHAVGGEEVFGYHLFNLAVHLASGLVLLGLARRTLLRPNLTALTPDATMLAGLIATLWVVHPLQTESVVGVIQRTELMVGLAYLLTFYCFVRAVDSTRPRRWLSAAVAAGFVGTACKEVMATAPLLLFLYDGIFVAGSFRAAWHRRRGFHLAMAASWLLLASLMLGSGQRSGTVGFGLGVTGWEYLLTQCRAIVLYLKLAIWPYPLVLDYGYPVVRELGEVLPQALLLVGLAIASGWAIWRRHPLGFAGAWFFIILGPSSSFVPLTTQTIAEHRMYLPLIAVVFPAVIGLARWLDRRAIVAVGSVIVMFALLTLVRNHDYRSALALWQDTATKAPTNARAQTNWGNALVRLGRRSEALPHYEEAIRLDPGYAEARHNLGLALLQDGRAQDAVGPFAEAVKLRPDDADAHRNFGSALALLGDLPAALEHYERAAKLEPEHAEGLGFYGWALLGAGRTAEAIPPLEKSVRLAPEVFNPRLDLANALVQANRLPEAVTHYEAASRLKPDDGAVHFNWGVCLLRLGRPGDAGGQFERVLQLSPADAAARDLLARARREAGNAR